MRHSNPPLSHNQRYRPPNFTWLLLTLVLVPLIGACTKPAKMSAQSDQALSLQAENWIIEQMPGGQVHFESNTLDIRDEAGCTVWLKKRLSTPVKISFTVKLISSDPQKERISDLNCFWMASDPQRPDRSVYEADHGLRSGKFSDYDSLQCYYVGMGGNTNTTTRFRRYQGGGIKPLLPEHDLQGKEFLLEGGKTYQITIESSAKGIRYLRDGRVFFDWKDPAPLTDGFFAFRTVWAHLQIANFTVIALPE